MLLKDKETYQYITIDSIKKYFHCVFGHSNDAMAEIMFMYMSNCRENLENVRINYYTFLQKFDPFFPKKPVNFSSYDSQEKDDVLFLKKMQ